MNDGEGRLARNGKIAYLSLFFRYSSIYRRKHLGSLQIQLGLF